MKNKSTILSVLLASLLLLLLFSCKKEDPEIIPIVTLMPVTNITATSATSGGEIISDGGVAVTERGVCWSTNQNPSTLDNKTSNGSGTGSFTSSITGLMSGVTYYIRAYAINIIGTAYSSQSTFNVVALLPVLATSDVSSVTSTTVITGGYIDKDGGAAVTARGVCWSKTPSPTINDSKTMDGTGTGNFTSTISNLEPQTAYYIRAYATNSIGTAYGNQITKTTLEPTILAYKTAFQYDSNGKRTEEIKYAKYSNKEEWVNYSKGLFSYDFQGRKTQSIYSKWDLSTQNWINYSKYTYSFFAFGIVWSGIDYIWDTASNNWKESYKHDNYSVDNKNSLLYVSYYAWSSYSWNERNKYRYEIILDSKGRIFQQTQVAYDEYQYGYYGAKSKGIFTYDSKGNIIDQKWTSWDKTYGWSDSGLSTSFTYDNNGNPTEKVTSKWNSNSSAYVVFSKIIYTYDSIGNQTGYIENLY